MPGIAIAYGVGVKGECFIAAVFQSYVARLKLARSNLELVGAVFAVWISGAPLGQQQVIERWHGTIMEIRCCCPDTVERARFVGPQRSIRIGGGVGIVISLLDGRLNLVT